MTLTNVRPSAKEMLTAVICLVLLLGGAFVAASLTKDVAIFSLSPPDGGPQDIQAGQRLDLYRAFFTAWAALILVAPALCTFLFRRTSESAARYWLAFWTVGFVAFVVHFYWAVFVIFGDDWNRILHTARVSAPIVDTVVTIWWGADVLLAWLARSERVLVRIQRALVHLLVFVLFFLGSAKEGELWWSKALGILMGVAVLISVILRVTRLLKKTKPSLAPAV